MSPLLRSLSLVLAMTSLCACDNMPGRPKPGPAVPRPQNVLDFKILYSQNCAGCHGSEGQFGPATPLANPEYLALVDDSTLTDIVANGQKNTMMPPFAERSGGNLTDEQVKALVKGIRAMWSKGNVLQSLNPPPYKSNRRR